MEWTQSKAGYYADFIVVPLLMLAACWTQVYYIGVTLLMVVMAILFYAVWTLAEYWIHRSLFHHFMRREHWLHHKRPGGFRIRSMVPHHPLPHPQRSVACSGASVCRQAPARSSGWRPDTSGTSTSTTVSTTARATANIFDGAVRCMMFTTPMAQSETSAWCSASGTMFLVRIFFRNGLDDEHLLV